MARILQLTDLHVFASAGQQLKGIPTRELLQQVVDHIQATEPEFDRVIITGDHTHDEQPESYRAVRDILSVWSDRLLHVPGNHDERALMQEGLSAVTHHADSSDQLTFCSDIDNWRLIGLDTHVPGEVAGHISDRQIAWLTDRLAESGASHVGLFFHHPPLDVGSEWMDAIGLANREALHTVMAADERIRLACCGHVHHEFTLDLGSARVFTTPSTGIQFDPEGTTPRFATAAPGYRVIELQPDGFQTHVVRLPTIPYAPFND